jgi:hypothetical protein
MRFCPRIAVSSPDLDSRAQVIASRRSVFTPSPQRFGIDDGVTPSQSMSCLLECRQITNPHGPAS